jgi:hypothetical protein
MIKCNQAYPPPPKKYPYFATAVRRVWSHALESYGGVVHLLVGHPMLDEKIYPGSPGWGFGHKANNLPSIKNLIAEKRNNGCQLDNSGERPRKSY